MYFYDTGIASSLLGIKNADTMALSSFRGPLFECFILADFFKQCFNLGTNAPLYFWRDRNGHTEIDCLVDNNTQLTPIEIKSGRTITADFFRSLKKWNELSESDPHHNYIIYGGDDIQKRTTGTVLGWQHAGTLLTKILA